MCIRFITLLTLILVFPLRGEETEFSLISGALRKSGLPVDEEIVTIPIKSTFTGFVVEVIINESPVQLILDTGASMTVLTTDAAKRIGLKVEKEQRVKVNDISGKIVILSRALTKRISLGGAWTKNEPVLVSNMPGYPVDGLLGIGTLVDWDIRIDPAEKTLTLFPNRTAKSLDGETTIPLNCQIVNPEVSSANSQGLRSINLVIPIKLGSHVLPAVPDTGFGGTLRLSDTLMKKFAPEAMEGALPALVKTVGVASKNTSSSVKLPLFSIGPDTLRELPAEVADIIPGSSKEDVGVVGLNLLRHYVMSFRFSAGELGLKPLGSVEEITNGSTAGINLGYGDDGRILVLSVTPEGPGVKAGIQAGDEMLEIEGRPLKAMKPKDFAAFKQLPPGSHVTVRFRRGEGKPVEVTLTLVKE